MTEAPAPAAAVQIVRDVFPYCGTPTRTELARIAVAALARAGWLHDPAENAALRAVADAAWRILEALDDDDLAGPTTDPAYDSLRAALDAAPAGTTTRGDG